MLPKNYENLTYDEDHFNNSFRKVFFPLSQQIKSIPLEVNLFITQ